MKNLDKALLAGLAATIVLSVLMVIKSALGLVPALNAIQMLTELSSTYLGLPSSPVVGWVAHLVIGVVIWGLVFAGTYDTWPGSPMMKGAVFSIMAWLLMGSMFLPMAGEGFFGMNLGLSVFITTFVLHLVFGLVLGAVYGRQTEGRVAHA